VRGITPAFLGVENVHRAGEHEEILGVDDHTIPSGQFDLLGKCARLRIPAIQVEDLEFQFAFHRRTFPNPPPRNPATTLIASWRSGLRGIADRSMTMPRLMA
jgi:hypothetical protein